MADIRVERNRLRGKSVDAAPCCDSAFVSPTSMAPVSPSWSTATPPAPFRQADAAGTRYVVWTVRTASRELVFDYGEGRLTTVSHDGATLFRIDRDGRGRIATVRDNHGRTVHYTYDSLGAVAEELTAAPTAGDTRASDRTAAALRCRRQARPRNDWAPGIRVAGIEMKPPNRGTRPDASSEQNEVARRAV